MRTNVHYLPPPVIAKFDSILGNRIDTDCAIAPWDLVMRPPDLGKPPPHCKLEQSRWRDVASTMISNSPSSD